MSRPTLITGATGLAGPAILRALAPRRPLRALSHRRPVEASVETVAGDLEDEDSLRRAMRGIGAVVHAGARMEGSDEEFSRANHLGTRALAIAAREEGVEQFVFVSTGLVYRPGPMRGGDESHPIEPQDAYARSKLAAERELAEILSDRATILRLPSLYQSAPCPFMNQLAVAIRDLELPWVPPHDPPIELLHVDDLAHAIALLLEVPPRGEVFNLGGFDLPTYRELVTTAASALPFEPRWVQLHAPEGDPLAAPGLERFPELLRLAATVPRTLSSERARNAFGYAPTHDWRVEIPSSMRAIIAETYS